MWSIIDNGVTIGTEGSEKGIIVKESHDSKIFTKKLLSSLPLWYNQSSFLC